MPIADTLNPSFSLPDMGDYYYDAPDQQRFYSDVDKAVNPLCKPNLNQAAVSKFYKCTPSELGAKNETYTFSVQFSAGDVDGGTEYVRGIKVDDGDTIGVPLSAIGCGDDASKQYLDKIMSDVKALAAITGGDYSNTKLTVRLAGLDCKELPHFSIAGSDDTTGKSELTSERGEFEIDVAAKNERCVYSKYQSFMDDYIYNEEPEGGIPIGKFFCYSRKLKKAKFVKMVDGCWHQYFEKDGKMYVLRACSSNSYDEDTIADAGVARDVVVNAIANASEMRIQVDGTKLSRTASEIHTMFGNNAAAKDKSFLDLFFDDYTVFTNAGFNCFGLDAYGRAIAVVYVCIGGVWVNLNKLVVADTNCTEVNKYAAARDGGIDTSSFSFDAKQYADNIYAGSKQFDDRDKVQGDIFGKLGKGQTLKALSDWTVTIGDVTLFVPPTSIRCLTQSKSEHMPVLRAKGTMAKSATKMQRVIEMDIYFNGDKGINGYKYETNTRADGKGQKVTYYMNGLRALYAQFRIAPFLPITNEYINMVLGVDAVTMINFSCDTVPNFPRLVKATIQLAEFEYRIYMPEIPRDDGDDDESGDLRNYFAEQINYPLLRYYYQRLLMHGQELKGVKFLDDKYITSTFGNRTCLVPADFKTPYIKFYIPNREHLEKLKQAKLQRILRRGQGSGATTLNAKDKQYAGDMAKLANEIEYLDTGGEDNYSPMKTLNTYLKHYTTKDNAEADGKEGEGENLAIVVDPQSGKLCIKEQVSDDNGNLSYEDTEASQKADTFLQNSINETIAQYTKNLAEVKNSESNALFTPTGSSTHFDPDTGKYSYNIHGILDTKYMTEEEMKNVKTLSTSEGIGTYTADEVAKNQEIDIPLTIKLSKTDTKNEHGNYYVASLGQDDADYFHVDKSKDVAFLAACAAIDDKGGAGGNDEVAELNKSISLVTKDTVKFEPYNDDEDFLVDSIHINTSNSFSQITLQETNGFAPQYVGGTDISINISLYTKSQTAAAAMNALPQIAAEYARDFRLVLTAWPLRIESEFTKLFGITEVMVESVEVDTVPNFPGLYHVSLMLVSVDRTLRNREAMRKKDMQNFHNLSIEGVAAERTWSYDEMNKYLSEAELYPDLELPTIEELSKMGFNFIRYSNEDRVYPDPDFYFTYSYILTSEIIREAILHGLDGAAANTSLKDSAGRSMNGNIKNSMGSWERNFEPSDVDEMQNLFSDPEEQATARIVTDFMGASDKHRDEVWTIAPNLKVAFAEKRILNHLNDHEKQKMQMAHGQETMRQLHPTNANEVIDTTTKNVDTDKAAVNKDESESKAEDTSASDTESQSSDSTAKSTSSNDTDDSEKPHTESKEEAAYNEMLADKYEAYTKTVGEYLEKVLYNPINEGQKLSTAMEQMYEAFGEADFAPYAGQSTQGKSVAATKSGQEDAAAADRKDTDAGLDEASTSWVSFNNSPWESGVMDKWLDAAADAFHSNSNCDYSPELDSPVKAVKDTLGIIDESAPWKRKQEWYAKIVYSEHDVRASFHNPKNNVKSYDREHGTPTLNPSNDEWLNLATYNSIEFGPFDFKFYSPDELRLRFGDYGNIVDSEGKEAVPRWGAYLADPYYRFRPVSEQNEYVRKCISDYEFAKKAFLRICMLYLRVLISYDILPSFSYDVFRGALKDKENMEKVLKAIQQRRAQKQADEEAKSEESKRWGTSKRYNGKSATGDAKKAMDESKAKLDQAKEKQKAADEKAKSGSDEDKKAAEQAAKDVETAQKDYDAKSQAYEEKKKESEESQKNQAANPAKEQTDEEKAKQQQQKTDDGNSTTQNSGDKTNTSSNQSSSTTTTDPSTNATGTDFSNIDVSEYLAMFKKNQAAVDNGKTFIMVLMGVLDGNTDFVSMLVDRKYSSLQSITHGCMSGQKTPSTDGDGQKSYFGKTRSFIRAIAGEQLIDKSKVGAGDMQEPEEVFSQYNGRKNVAAASEDPSKYMVHSFYDMVVHDCRGRMLRAFPTFYFVLIDEGRKIGRWKLHDNFYNVNSIASITVSKSRKIPTDTAEVVMSNYYNTFTNSDETLNNNYTTNFTDVFRSIWLPTLESYAIEQEKKWTDAENPERFRIRAGARIHIRFGYGADASSLPTVFNGMVAECETSDTVTLICQSDGAELCKPVLLERDAHELPGMDQATGFDNWCENGATPKQIMQALLTYKGGYINSWMHKEGLDDIANKFGDPINPLGIYHFGNPDINYAGDPEPMQNILEVGINRPQDRYTRDSKNTIGDKLSNSISSAVIGAAGGAAGGFAGGLIFGGIGAIPGAGIGAAIGFATGLSSAWDANEPLKLNFEVFGKTVWDIANICKSVEPDYYVGIMPFHLRSTLFIGRGQDYVAYDYQKINGTWVEKRKPYQQAHIYDSCTDIINNSIRVSTKDIKTCAVGLYEVSGFMNAKVQKKTDPQWVDANIYPEYQKTMFVDTKLFGEPSRTFGYVSDFFNWFMGGITNSTLDRACDEKGDVKNHHAMAVRMTVDALKQQMKEMYAGQFTVIGDPTVKPNDRIILNDTYDGIGGQCLVRDVVQVFSADAGFKTVITPDLITAQVGQDAAYEMKKQNYGLLATNAVISVLAIMLKNTVKNAALKRFAEAKTKLTAKLKGNKTLKKLNSGWKAKRPNIQNNKIASGLMSSVKNTLQKFTSKMAGTTVGKVASTAGTVINKGGAAKDFLSKFLKQGGKSAFKGADIPMTIACTLGLGCIEDFIASKINSRKRLVIFPLQKYQRPMVGGVDGNVGTVYGSPNFSSETGVSAMFNTFKSEYPHLGSAIDFVADLIGVEQDEANRRLDKVANSPEGKAQASFQAANNSQLEMFRNAYFNPAQTRLDVKKQSSKTLAQGMYGVTAKDEEGISADGNFNKMKPVIGEKKLKKYMDLGFFRVAAFERGFTSAISDKVHCMYIMDPVQKKYLPVNAVVDDSNGTADIPYLNGDALGVLCHIVQNAFTYMAGTEQERDAAQWYKDNASSFITLTSALKCGSTKNYENTGFSFVLNATDDKSRKALVEGAKHVNETMKLAHTKTSSVPKKVMEIKESGNDLYVVVCPPSTVEEI